MDMSTLASRLKHEIEKEHGGVTRAAKCLGVSRNTIYNYMQEGNIPANKLASLQTIGIDIVYVLVGVRQEMHQIFQSMKMNLRFMELMHHKYGNKWPGRLNTAAHEKVWKDVLSEYNDA